MESVYVPLPHLANTNAPLNTAEEDSVRQRLRAMELQAFDLRMELKILSRHIREYKHILSLIRRIPMEVLGEIFTCIPPEDDDRPQNYQDDLVRLSLVCKRWRDAARLTPQLWQDLDIDAGSRSLEYEALSAWASRSGDLRRSISIHAKKCGRRGSSRRGATYMERLPSCSGEGSCIFANPVFQAVLGWQQGVSYALDIACPSPGCFQQLGNMLATQWPSAQPRRPSIQSFTLHSDGWGCWPVDPPRSLFHFLPTSITTLTLTLPDLYGFGEEIHNYEIDLQVPNSLLEGLTSFSIACDMLAGHLFRLLPHCKNLETLSIDFDQGVLDDWSSDPTTEHALKHGFTLPKLHTLRLTNAGDFGGMECVRMPELVELSMEVAPGVHCEIGQEYFCTLVRGDPSLTSKLRTLSITNVSFYKNALFDALKDLASLTHLTLDEVLMEKDVFLRLSKPTPCLPRLKVLKLRRIWAEHVDEILHLQEFVDERSINLYLRTEPALSIHARFPVAFTTPLAQRRWATPFSPAGFPHSCHNAQFACLRSHASSATSPSTSSSTPTPAPAPPVTEAVSSLDALSFDEKTRAAAEAGPEFAAALERQRLRESEEAKMLCSIENKEACLMCSG